VGPREQSKRTLEMIAFGARLRELRRKKGWTQEELGERAEMNGIQVGHIERGASDPKLSTVLKLARALGVSAADLLDVPALKNVP
jgi:transcriptional regulator with XRE-family HTH domain